MNETDLRDCFAMLRGVTGASAKECYEFADEMLETRKEKDDVEKLGIAAPNRPATLFSIRRLHLRRTKCLCQS
jgi:hypothetical protein